MRRIALWVVGVLCFLAVSACSSGGGGGGGDGKAGEFTLAKNQVALQGFSFNDGNLQGNYEVVEEVAMTLTNTGGVAYVGAAYLQGQGQQPAWLAIDVQGSGSRYRVVLTAYPSLATQNESSTTFAVGTADSNGNVLTSQNITVRLNLTTATLRLEGDTAIGLATVLGGNQEPWQFDHELTALSTQWQASSNQPWLSVADTAGTGSANLTTTVDPRGLSPGSYQGLVTVRQVGVANHFVTLTFNVEIGAPTLSISATELNLGGASGTETPTATLSLALNTGPGEHPFTVSASTTDGAAWLSPNDLGGTLSEDPTTLTISADPGLVQPGVFQGSLTITATVAGTTLTETVQVTYINEEQRLMTGVSGVALVSGPGVEVTERSIPIFANGAQRPWQAESDQVWLTVSDAGLTGENLTLSANASGLAAGETHFAEVTVTSSGITGQTIRVGLTVLAEAPQLLSVDLPATDVTYDSDPGFPVLAASPVEPLVFTNVAGKVVAYNVYTGIQERVFAEVIAGIGGMSVSGDGRTLFVYDNVNFNVLELDATSGARGRDFATQGPANHLLQPAWVQVDGVPMLVGVGSHIYNLATGMEATAADTLVPGGPSLAGTVGHPNLVAQLDGAVFRLSYSAATGGKVVATPVAEAPYQSNPAQACLDATATKVFTASGAPYTFPAYSLETNQQVQELPGTAYPNAVTCTWSGIIVGGADAYYDAEDIFVYSSSGIDLGRFSSSTRTSYRDLVPRALTVSGDAARIIAISQNAGDPNQLRLLPMPE